ncbi:MAG TPA: sigma-70 family RNA polymerase sigma factor [Candidatus Limnocylindrales bacterium]|nr:sigma-70 family RNA polymerase sigma factor [Candidatus Limnocylindrales bacterium]
MGSPHGTALADAEAPAVRGDVDLVRRAQHGDASAYDDLIRPRIERLLRLAISIIGNEPDGRDVVQDVCVQVWQALPNLRDPERFDAWLSRILVNGCRSNMRGRRRVAVREISMDGVMGDGPASDDPVPSDHLSTNDAIRRAFDRLDADKRSILVLHHVDGRSVTEIADLLRIPKGTAMWRLHAARRSLERALEVERR